VKILSKKLTSQLVDQCDGLMLLRGCASEDDELKHLIAKRIIGAQTTLLIYAILSEFCLRLSEAMDVLSSSRAVPANLRPTVDSVMFCAHRIALVDELTELRSEFRVKFQEAWYKRAVDNDDHTVNYRLVELFSNEPSEHKIHETIAKFSKPQQLLDAGAEGSQFLGCVDEWLPSNPLPVTSSGISQRQ